MDSSWTPSGTATRTTSSSSATTAGGVGRRSWGRGPGPACSVKRFLSLFSGIRGGELRCIYPADPSEASPYETRRSVRHVIFTAETHNFPTGRRPPPRSSHEYRCGSYPNKRCLVNSEPCRCCAVQRRHHGYRRSHQRRPERRTRGARRRWDCGILLRKPAHPR